jgi:hypothetical protein
MENEDIETIDVFSKFAKRFGPLERTGKRDHPDHAQRLRR